MRLGLPGQSKSARYQMIRAVDRHCLHYWAGTQPPTAIADRLDLLDRFVETQLHVSNLETNRGGKVIILRARTSPVGSLPSFNFAD